MSQEGVTGFLFTTGGGLDASEAATGTINMASPTGSAVMLLLIPTNPETNTVLMELSLSVSEAASIQIILTITGQGNTTVASKEV